MSANIQSASCLCAKWGGWWSVSVFGVFTVTPWPCTRVHTPDKLDAKRSPIIVTESISATRGKVWARGRGFQKFHNCQSFQIRMVSGCVEDDSLCKSVNVFRGVCACVREKECMVPLKGGGKKNKVKASMLEQEKHQEQHWQTPGTMWRWYQNWGRTVRAAAH